MRRQMVTTMYNNENNLNIICCKDGKEAHGLKLEKTGLIFQVLMPCLQKSPKKILL